MFRSSPRWAETRSGIASRAALRSVIIEVQAAATASACNNVPPSRAACCSARSAWARVRRSFSAASSGSAARRAAADRVFSQYARTVDFSGNKCCPFCETRWMIPSRASWWILAPVSPSQCPCRNRAAHKQRARFVHGCRRSSCSHPTVAGTGLRRGRGQVPVQGRRAKAGSRVPG